MISNNCIACRTEKRFLGKTNGFDIDVCPNCGLGETRGESRLQYHDYHRDIDYQFNQNQFKNIFQKRVDLIEKYLKTGKVLEVGSSIGLLLSSFKKDGWEVEGVEPSKTAYRVAMKEGIPTQNTSFEKAELKEAFYDLVVFNHVLEHMEDPVEALKKVKRVLKKGGLMLIDVPNFGGIKAGIMGAQWRFILPDEHRWHFTKHSLEIMLHDFGFEVIYAETRSGIWDYSDSPEELFSSLFGFKKRFFSEFFFAFPDFIVSKLGWGSGLTIVAIAKK